MIDPKSTAIEAPEQNFEVFRGAPRPMIFEIESGGVLRSFDNTLRATISVRGVQTIHLTVGSGITLSASDGVPNARVTMQLTRSQSRQIPLGWFSTIEVQEGTGEGERGVLSGKLKGKGGNNADV